MGIAAQIALENLIFFLVASGILFFAWRNWRGSAVFEGSPRRKTGWFKYWLTAIWVFTFALPLCVMLWMWLGVGSSLALVAFLPYFVMLFAQIGTELFIWKKHNSVVWVLVPCLYLQWRLFQVYRGTEIMPMDPQHLIAHVTLWILFAMWVVNTAIHYTGIPASLKWPKGEVEEVSLKPAG